MVRLDLMTAREIRAYYAGVREGIDRYAIWHDGEQRVGALLRPLPDVLARLDTEERGALERWGGEDSPNNAPTRTSVDPPS